MPSYIYNIGQEYTSIQQAINLITNDLDNGWVPTDDIKINVGDGIYAGFTIPNGTLLPLLGTVYRLIIQSAGNYFPIIDFNASNSDQVVGIDLGSANPNVTIDNLRIQYFSVGIRADLNSHNLKVKNSIISNNRNVGIFVNEVNNVQILQSIAVNGDYGIVARLCKNISIIHNTIFLNGSLSNENGKAKSAIWVQSARDYGNGITDTGKIHLIGNIAWNTVGTTLTVFSNDVETAGLLVSNYNDFVVGDQSRFISIEDDSTYHGAGTLPRRLLTNLNSWKALGFDQDSRSQDPRFIVPVSVGNNKGTKHSLDLNLLSISTVLGVVPSFFVNPTATNTWLPDYVDSSELSEDILGNPRQQNGTAIGANDRASNAGFYGQDVLSAPLDINQAPECGVNPLEDIIQKNLYTWYPSYKKGYFYSYERGFYLYAKKYCADLQELAVTKLTLPSRVAISKGYTIKLNGIILSDQEQYDIRGRDLFIFHKSIGLRSFDEEVDIEYFVPVWEQGRFSYVKTYVKLKLNQGETRYYLPKNYVPEGPVIITDDTVGLSNKDLFTNREYSVDLDPQEQLSEIKFSQNFNKIDNSSFNYSYGEAPKSWYSSGAMVTTGNLLVDPILGNYLCLISGNGFIEQLVNTNTGESCLSFYASTVSGSIVDYNLKFYDSYNRDLGYVRTGSITPELQWNRYYLNLGTTGNSIFTTPVEDYDISYIEHIDVPEDSAYIKVRLSSKSGDSLIDAVQYELNSYPSVYHKKIVPLEYTVEFETSDSENFIDYNQNLSPTINQMSEGFIYIPEIPARCYDGPNDYSISTFFEWKWSNGRKYHIPWARIFGKDKLKRKIRFNDYPLPDEDISLFASKTPALKEVNLLPSIPIGIQGGNGVNFTIIAEDVYGNPSANMKFEAYVSDQNLAYPGLLAKKLYGLKEQLGQVVLGYLSHAGAIGLQWIPPSEEDSKIVMQSLPVPISQSNNGQSISFIRTRYPVNLDYHGNVIIMDSSGNQFNTVSKDILKANYITTKTIDYSTVKLDYPISAGSVFVKVGDTIYDETQSGDPETNQYYVDYENSVTGGH